MKQDLAPKCLPDQFLTFVWCTGPPKRTLGSRPDVDSSLVYTSAASHCAFRVVEALLWLLAVHWIVM